MCPKSLQDELPTAGRQLKLGYQTKESFQSLVGQFNYENLPMQYTEIFKVVKYENFHWKKLDIFLIFAQNIDCESHNLVLEQKEKPCIPTFCYIKAGYKGVYIIRTLLTNL